MDIKTAKEVAMHIAPSVKVVNAIDTYANYRIEVLRSEMEKTKDDRRVHELQGAIEELRRIFNLRTHALAVVDNKD